jgi:hypothetical protein
VTASLNPAAGNSPNGNDVATLVLACQNRDAVNYHHITVGCSIRVQSWLADMFRQCDYETGSHYGTDLHRPTANEFQSIEVLRKDNCSGQPD